MASVNRVLLLGRLTRDVEVRTFANGGRVASWGMAINSRRKNQSTGQWEDAPPTFVDVEAFGKTAELAAEHLRKGSQVFLEGHLKTDEWQDKTSGQKRTKLKVVADAVQFLDPRGPSGGADGDRRPAGAASRQPARQSAQADYDAPPDDDPGF